MPLSSWRDMSVSISPWCLGHCAHRGGGEAMEGSAFSLSTAAYPRFCTLSHPSFNLWGKVWRMQSGQVGGTSGSVYKATRGWVTGSPSSPPLLPFHCAFPPTPFPPLVPVSGAVVEISEVRWCFSLAAHTISLYPSPQWPPPRSSSQSGATFDMLRQHFLCSQRLSS